MAISILDAIIKGVDAGLKVAEKLLSNKPTRTQVAEAIGSIQKAVIKTHMFIAKEGNVPSEEIALIWVDAMEKVVSAQLDDELPDYLISKARYWRDPSKWLNNPNSLKLVPKLTELEMKCDVLLMSLKN